MSEKQESLVEYLDDRWDESENEVRIWRGPEDGLPPAGTVCDLEWFSQLETGVTITYQGDGVGCYKREDGKEYTYATDSVKFHPHHSHKRAGKQA